MKKILIILTLSACALALTACSTGPDMTAATNTPPAATATPEPIPDVTEVLPGTGMDVTDSTGTTDGGMTIPEPTDMPASTGVTSMDKARRAIEQIEDELERLSEVDDAQVVIAGSKAAVALEFDDQYRGGIDERLRGIVKERIDSVISGISTIAVTSDSAIMDALESLGDRLEGTADMTALQNDLDAVIRKIENARA